MSTCFPLSKNWVNPYHTEWSEGYIYFAFSWTVLFRVCVRASNKCRSADFNPRYISPGAAKLMSSSYQFNRSGACRLLPRCGQLVATRREGQATLAKGSCVQRPTKIASTSHENHACQPREARKRKYTVRQSPISQRLCWENCAQMVAVLSWWTWQTK